jgi:hypothetical protein
MVRIKTEFMESLVNAFGEQTKSLADAYTKTAAEAMKNPLSGMSWVGALFCLFSAMSLELLLMPRFYEPDLSTDPNSPFARDAAHKLVRRGYWMDMDDRTLVMVMFNGIGAI